VIIEVYDDEQAKDVEGMARYVQGALAMKDRIERNARAKP